MTLHRCRRYVSWLILALLTITTGCKDDETELAGEEPDRAVNEVPAVAATGRGCNTLSSMPGPDLLSIDSRSTPRSNASAEILAIEVSRETTAPTALYERVVAELAGLRSLFPQRTATEARPCSDASSLLVQLNATGETDQINLFNEKLRLQSSKISFRKTRVLRFDGRYNTLRLAQQYGGLENVEVVEINFIRGDGDDLGLELRGSDHLYIFDTGIGDCPSGCFSHNFEGFSVDKDGNITDLGGFSRDGAEHDPDWFTNAIGCRAFL